MTRDNLDLKLTWDLEGEKLVLLEALQVPFEKIKHEDIFSSSGFRHRRRQFLLCGVCGSASDIPKQEKVYQRWNELGTNNNLVFNQQYHMIHRYQGGPCCTHPLLLFHNPRRTKRP